MNSSNEFSTLNGSLSIVSIVVYDDYFLLDVHSIEEQQISYDVHVQIQVVSLSQLIVVLLRCYVI